MESMEEASISLIEEQCREQIQAYMMCVENNPYSWRTDCREEKYELSQCSSMNPMIKHINKSCNVEFKKYNTCMIENEQDVTVCTNVLAAFNECAAKASDEYKNVVMTAKSEA